MRRRLRRRLSPHPAQVVVLGFGGAIGVVTLLLMLPVSTAGGEPAPFDVALFTATSAVCVTGLVVVDTGSYWSGFGEGVILGGIQAGGLGIVTMASLVGILIARRAGLTSRLSATAEKGSSGGGDLRALLLGIVRVAVVAEVLTGLLLFGRFWLGYGEPVGRAAYLALFHAVSAFNNAGFALWDDSLTRYAADAWVCVPVLLAVIVGGLGFPVWIEMRHNLRNPHAWSLHARMTVAATAVLLVGGGAFVTVTEWTNPDTLGALDRPGRLLAGFFHGAMPRTAGFNTVDVGSMGDGTLLGTVILMFVGGGSAGTAGGIKVTTFLLLFMVIAAEVRGEPDVAAFRRRVGARAVRQAVAVVTLGALAVLGSTIVLLELSSATLSEALFETTSAFGTVGLSTGITAELPTAGQMLLVLLMFVGRLGPITLVSSLALRESHRRYHHPEGRPLIG